MLFTYVMIASTIVAVLAEACRDDAEGCAAQLQNGICESDLKEQCRLTCKLCSSKQETELDVECCTQHNAQEKKRRHKQNVLLI
ncbi:hypothetical protein Tcan_18762 [Toxocara canis]|uniref:ShKT domain-containing protein n=1 Tax=Toxocara canis TaxID=6265 RepID=A0A0B2VQ80_TOXCA|nr:hypothetical protein Tcan_18762 [Toxocara canis]